LSKPIKQDVLLQAIKDYSAAALPSSQGRGSPKGRASRASQKLAERTPAYLENCRRTVILMQEALDRADFEAVTTLGHNLRGSGGGFGFQAITDIGAGLERAAEDADFDVSRRWVSELSSYLDRIETEIRLQ